MNFSGPWLGGSNVQAKQMARIATFSLPFA